MPARRTATTTTVTIAAEVVEQKRMQNAREMHAKQKRLQDAVGVAASSSFPAAFVDNLKVSSGTLQDTGTHGDCIATWLHMQLMRLPLLLLLLH